jgi:hypothetical protein
MQLYAIKCNYARKRKIGMKMRKMNDCGSAALCSARVAKRTAHKSHSAALDLRRQAVQEQAKFAAL